MKLASRVRLSSWGYVGFSLVSICQGAPFWAPFLAATAIDPPHEKKSLVLACLRERRGVSRRAAERALRWAGNLEDARAAWLIDPVKTAGFVLGFGWFGVGLEWVLVFSLVSGESYCKKGQTAKKGGPSCPTVPGSPAPISTSFEDRSEDPSKKDNKVSQFSPPVQWVELLGWHSFLSGGGPTNCKPSTPE